MNTPTKIEPFGLDEAWLDVTDNKDMSGKEVAADINRRIKQELGITVSIGVSFNKNFCQIRSDYKKPDAITEITREKLQRYCVELSCKRPFVCWQSNGQKA